MTRSGSPLDKTIEEMAGVILQPLDLGDDEISAIVEEWCSFDFEEGQATRCLAKLQRIAFEYLLKRSGNWEDYLEQFSGGSAPLGIALAEG